MQFSLLMSNNRLLELEWLLAMGNTVQSSFLRSNIRQLELKTAKLHFEAVTEWAMISNLHSKRQLSIRNCFESAAESATGCLQLNDSAVGVIGNREYCAISRQLLN